MSIYRLFNSDEVINDEYEELSDSEVNKIMARFKAERPQKSRVGKRLGRRFVAVAAAVAVAVSGGILTYAYDKGLLPIIFGGGGESYVNLDGLTGEMDIHSLEVYRDDVTVTPEGYASDGNVLFCVFRMDFERKLFRSADAEYSELSRNIIIDGKKYHENHYTDKVLALGEMLPTGYDSSIGANTVLKRADDDTMYAIFEVTPSLMSEGTKELDYTCLNIGRDNKPLIDEYIFSAEFSVEIADGGYVSMKTEGTVLDGCTLTVTPCIVRIEKYAEELFAISEKLYFGDLRACYLLLNDGSKVYFSGFSGSGSQLDSGEGYTELTAQLDIPVDINSVSAVVMGENEFTVNS